MELALIERLRDATHEMVSKNRASGTRSCLRIATHCIRHRSATDIADSGIHEGLENIRIKRNPAPSRAPGSVSDRKQGGSTQVANTGLRLLVGSKISAHDRAWSSMIVIARCLPRRRRHRIGLEPRHTFAGNTFAMANRFGLFRLAAPRVHGCTRCKLSRQDRLPADCNGVRADRAVSDTVP